MTKKKIILSIINDFVGDQRVQRIAGHLHDIGYEVQIVCRQLPNSLPVQGFPYSVHRMSLFFLKGKLFYAEFTIRLFLYLLFQKSDIFVANDLDTLLPNFLISKLKAKRLIYDSHEYFTECPEIIHRPLVQKVWTKIEQFIFPKLRTAYTVNKSISEIYAKKYLIPVQVVRNLPIRKASVQIDMQLRQQQKILLYQGALNLGRGIDLMVEAMRFLPEYQLWIIGKGDVENELKAMAKEDKNVHFLGFKTPKELHEITLQGLLGFSLEEDLGGNYHYASPNKLVDYIQAQVPYICSELPEMQKLTSEYNCGFVLPLAERTPQNLANYVRKICENPARYEQLQKSCQKSAFILCWENEKGKITEIYKNDLS